MEEAKIFIEAINASITMMLAWQIFFALLFEWKKNKDHFKWARVWLDVLTINGVMIVLAQLVYYIFHYNKWGELIFLIILVWLFTQLLGMRERFTFTQMSIKVLENLKRDVKDMKEKTVKKE